jgi:anti-sigma-K factor RskA
MSELNEMGCEEFDAVAAELALGVLTGRERAEALAHLDGCDACRENVHQLTMVGEGLLGLLPASEPPPGFETQVMERLGLAVPAAGAPGTPGKERGAGAPRGQRAGWTRRMLAVAAVVVVIAGAGLAGWGLHAATSTPPRSPLSSAALLTATHEQVGKIYFYDGNPQWFSMAVDLPRESSTVICQLVSQDGAITTVGTFRLVNGDGAWGSSAWASHGPVTAARLVSTDGTVLATATLPQT